jgi:hypothetical protein
MPSHFEEAEQAARRALQFDPDRRELYARIAMMKHRKITLETAARLAMAVKKHPRAVHFLGSSAICSGPDLEPPEL